MKRLAGTVIATVVACVCAFALTVVGSSPARADDSGAQGYWDKYVAPAFDDEAGVDGSTNPISSPFDKVYNFIFGTTDTVGFTASGDTCYLGTPGCNEVMTGYAPSPGGVAPTFVKGAEVAGVTVKAGNATVTGAGMLFNMTGAAASHLTVDTDTTELEYQAGGSPGWVGGTNGIVYPNGAVFSYAVSGDLLYGAGSGTATITQARTMSAGSGSNWSWTFYCKTVGTGVVATCGSQSSNGNSATAQTPLTHTFTSGLVFDHIEVRGYITSPAFDVTLTYWPPGAPLYPANAGALVGSVESSYVCREQDGDTRTATASVAVDEALGQVAVDLPSFSCAADELLLGALVEWVTDEGRQTIYDYEAPSWVQDTPAEWQDCGTKNCDLKLYHEGTYCGENAVGCPDWWDQDADGYTCKYGSHAVDLNYCAIYRNPGQKSPNGKVTVDIDGDLHYDTPEGKPRSWFDTLPKAPPATPETVNPYDPDPVPPGKGDVSSSSSRCFPTGWGEFNPLEWVYRPVTCALTWAFVPRQAVVEQQLVTVQDDVMSKPPFAIIGAGVPMVQGLFGGYTSGTCGFGNFWPQGSEVLTIQCATPAGWGPVYGIAVVVIWAGALWQAVRMVAAGIGNREAG